MLIDNPLGNFRFLKGIDVFSFGAVADPGYEIVQVTFHPLPPLQKGFELIEQHLRRSQRPRQALCGTKLRIPQPLSAEAFSEFNRPYIQKLADWNVLVEGLNPVARTNVAPVVNPVAEPSVYGFAYTAPAQHQGVTFVVAGVAEERRQPDEQSDRTTPGEVSPAELRQKVESVLRGLTTRLQTLQVGWADVTAVAVYTTHDIHPLLATTILPALEGANRRGLRWHYARPPVVQLECEMDARGVRQEIVLPG